MQCNISVIAKFLTCSLINKILNTLLDCVMISVSILCFKWSGYSQLSEDIRLLRTTFSQALRHDLQYQSMFLYYALLVTLYNHR